MMSRRESACGDRGGRVQVPGDFAFPVAERTGLVTQADAAQHDLLDHPSTYVGGRRGVMIAGNPQRVGRRRQAAQERQIGGIDAPARPFVVKTVAKQDQAFRTRGRHHRAKLEKRLPGVIGW
jgi:hypothetical protein